MTRKHQLSAIGGFGLATAFFMPIAAVATLDPPAMMWTSLHTAELACAWALYAGVAALGLGCVGHDPSPRRESVWILAISTPSVLSLLVMTGRTATGAGANADTVRLIAIGAAIVGFIIAALLWVWKPAPLVRMFRTIVPFGLLLLVPGVGSMAALSIPPRGAPPLTSAAAAGWLPGGGRCGNVYVLLFDELAYDAAFTGGRVTMKSLATRIAAARVYHRAFSPATYTAPSIEAYISVPSIRPGDRPSSVKGLFGAAQASGMETEVVGWYFPYCESLGTAATRCRSFSLYNAATVHDGFSVLAPVETVLNIWPYAMPMGLLKGPAAVWLHKAALEAISALAEAPPPSRPVFRWVHFNVPHFPWLQDAGPMDLRAIELTREHYLRQVELADRALDTTLAALERSASAPNTVVVITSDHGQKNGLSGDPLHVPLIVWTPGGTHQDVFENVRVRDVLKQVVAGACRQ
jgi:hypothetical protein